GRRSSVISSCGRMLRTPSRSGTTSSRSRRAEPRHGRNGDMDLGLDGRVVLLAGASRGIGLAAARAFAGEGCRVALMARDRAGLAAAAGEVRQAVRGRGA